jgi:hypothetical protein
MARNPGAAWSTRLAQQGSAAVPLAMARTCPLHVLVNTSPVPSTLCSVLAASEAGDLASRWLCTTSQPSGL